MKNSYFIAVILYLLAPSSVLFAEAIYTYVSASVMFNCIFSPRMRAFIIIFNYFCFILFRLKITVIAPSAAFRHVIFTRFIIIELSILLIFYLFFFNHHIRFAVCTNDVNNKIFPFKPFLILSMHVIIFNYFAHISHNFILNIL